MALHDTDANFKGIFASGSSIIPTFWSATLLEDLKKELVFGSLTNSQYIGQVKYGQTLKIFSVSDVRITDYSPENGFGVGVPDRAYAKEALTLTIDNAKAFQFFVEDLEDRAVLVDLMSAIMRETTYNLRDVVDQYIAGLFEAGATPFLTDTGTGAEIAANLSDTYTFYDLLVDVDTLMNKNNVPRNGRWIVVPPELRALLLKDNRFVANASSPQAYVSLLNGEVGQAAGFTVKMSNNIPSTPDASGNYRFYAGTNDALAFAYDVEKIETYRPENRFADAVKGLFVYGAKLIRPVCAYKVKVQLPAAP